MSTHGDGGKGSGRRKEDASKIRDNWDLIFNSSNKGTKAVSQDIKEHEMIRDEEDPQERSDEDIERSEYHEEEWTCDVCGGPMYSAPHWSYGKCDDCGATQGLINDDYL